MPWPTAFHERTSALCTSLLYKEWAGCYAVKRYDLYHEREYYALRHAVTVLDATPLYKYDLTGPDAARFLSWLSVRDFASHKPGRVSYVAWCDERGKVLDDGTITRFDERSFRLTSADPSWAWLTDRSEGFDVKIVDQSRTLAALAVQGPHARALVRELVGPRIDKLGYFRALRARVGPAAPGRGFDLTVTRTGYTGDLGYELWVANEHALALWDALFEAGQPLGILAMGLDALDVARVEAGYVLQGCDYYSARTALIDHQRSTPYELGFDWMVQLEREPFVGQRALQAEAASGGAARKLVGLEIDWEEFERLHEAWGLPPHLAAETSREGVPIYHGGRQVGQATSRAWSPTLKKYLALATVRREHAEPGRELAIEVTVEHERQVATARVMPLPFFDPPRKKETVES